MPGQSKSPNPRQHQHAAARRDLRSDGRHRNHCRPLIEMFESYVNTSPVVEGGVSGEIANNSAASESWSGNRYDAPAVPPGSWFTLGTVSAVEDTPPPPLTSLSIDGWRQAVEPTAEATHLNYVDQTRSAATYNQTLGGSPTLQAFLSGARAQSKAQWQPVYTATAVESYVRAGFVVSTT